MLSPKKKSFLKLSLVGLLSLSILAGCGGVSNDTLRPVWTKQVNQEVTPMMGNVFSPISSNVITTFTLTADHNWDDVSEDKLPNYKYGLQHSTGSLDKLDPSLTIKVVLDQTTDSYQLNQLVEQIWSAKQQLKMNGINNADLVIRDKQGKEVFNGWLQTINNPEDANQYLHMNTTG